MYIFCLELSMITLAVFIVLQIDRLIWIEIDYRIDQKLEREAELETD